MASRQLAVIGKGKEDVSVILEKLGNILQLYAKLVGHGLQLLPRLGNVWIAKQGDDILETLDGNVIASEYLHDHGAREGRHVLAEFPGFLLRQLELIVIVDGDVELAQRQPQAIDVIAACLRQLAQHYEIGMRLVFRPPELRRQVLDFNLSAPRLFVREWLDDAFQADVFDKPRALQGRCF